MRNENVKRRFEELSVQAHTFRLSIALHGYLIHPVAILKHVSIEIGEKFFELVFV